LLSEVSEDEDKDEDDDSSAMITGNLFAHGSGVGGGGGDDEYGGEEGDGEDDLYFPNPDDADSVPDAEVNKYSFLKHLCHYMEGNKISNANRKCVEWTIPFEVGTFVRTMDTLRTADTKDMVFDKYVNKIHDIEDEHFETNSVRTKMLRIGSRLVSRICVVEICCVSGRVKQSTSDRSGTNFQESVGCLTCQVDPIRSSTQRSRILLLFGRMRI
jgi:hypothetical protein